ncbi:MAG TPA: DEAD/DEAH box helicase, partial [Bacteroidales bacterium]|nr:DEAD/DEAH box helicase [Bacteroidales bacterium]
GKTIQVISMLDAHFARYRKAAISFGQRQQNLRLDGQLQLFEEQSPDQDPAAEVEKPRPALVVMPTSLIHNWKEEFKRFAPLLRIYEFTGNNRNLQLALGGDFHVLLTTYGVMRIESYDLSQYPFSFVVLDESQQIKNPASKTAQAVFILNGKHRIAMTGTPVENHLSDLWSQMNFLNPGLLGDLSVFNKYYSVPISRDAQSKQREKLLRIISPFVLRRTKHQVAKELPPVTENYVFCGMSEMQRQRYEEEKSRMRIALMDEVDENVRRSEVAVRYLTALMKLRQLANHPGILFPDENSESGKFAELLQHLETILDENHKVLIFSSFVSLLAILAGELEKLNVSYAMLTGETQHREDVVKSFKNGNKHVFLISLKAGGVGLNLAEADYVFVLDPWWNPAAEAQAIGRSHRIGQQRSVFVYRFITRNSIEEKIMKLQAEKKILAESTIVEESFYSSMSREQLLGLLQDETESPEQDAEM